MPNRTATIVTDKGTITFELSEDLAPITTANFIGLAESKFYDGLNFHRVEPGFVIQGGDPTQTSAGGPGYSTVDKPPAEAKYTKGTVAMAKSPDEAPGTSGSQFFVVTDDAAADMLTPDYAIVGQVTDGMDTIDRIAELAVGDGPPSQPVVVSSVIVAES